MSLMFTEYENVKGNYKTVFVNVLYLNNYQYFLLVGVLYTVISLF